MGAFMTGADREAHPRHPQRRRRARPADGVGPGDRRRAGPRLRRGRAGGHGRVLDLGADAVRAAPARPAVRLRLHPPRRRDHAAAPRGRRRLARRDAATACGSRPGGRAPAIGHITDIVCFVPGEEPEVDGEDDRAGRRAASTMMDYVASITYRNPVPPPSTGRSTASRGAPPPRQASARSAAGLRRRARATARSTPSSSGPSTRSTCPQTGHDHQLHDRHAGAVPGPDRDRAVRPGLRPARRHRRDPRLPAGDRAARRRGAGRPAGVAPCGPRRPRRSTRAGGMGGAYGSLLGWIPDRRARHRRPRPREPDLLMATSKDIAVVGWAQTPMVRHTDQSETQLLLDVITDALTPLGLTRADVDFTCLGSCDYITGQAFSFVTNLDAIGAWPPKRDSPRRDGRRVGAVRGVAPPAGGRHRDRRRHRLRPLVDRRPGAHLPDGDGPVLPRAARRRPADVRRPPGPGGHRRRHRRRAVDGRGRRSGPGARARSTSCWRATTCASRCAATTSRRSPTAPPPWCWPPATGPASWSSDRRTSPASTTAPSATTRRSGPSTTRRRPASPPRPPAWATAPVEVAELQAAFTHEELLLRQRARARRRRRRSTRRAAPLKSNPIMATGLCRIGYAADHIFGGGNRALAHSTSGPVPATEPRSASWRDGAVIPTRRRRRRPDAPQVPPPRRLVRRPRPRGRVPGPRRRPHDDGRHRRRRPRQGPRPVRGRDEARALPVRRPRRGRQADVPGPHRRLGRRHDRPSSPPPTSRPASTRRVLAVAFEKQSEGNAQFALGSGKGASLGAGGAFAPFIRAYIHRSGAPEHIGWKVAVKDRLNALKNPYAHLKIEDISIEKVKESPDDVGADPLPRVVPVVGRRRARWSSPTRTGGKAAAADGRPPAWILGTSSRSRAAELPRPRPGPPRRPACECVDDVYARPASPTRASSSTWPSCTCRSRGTRPSGWRATASPSPARAGR